MNLSIKIFYNNFKDIDNILANSNYLRLNSDNYGWICGFENNKLIYILPFIEKTKYFFKYISFVSKTIKIDDTSINEKDFLNNVILFLKKEKIYDFISQPKTNVVFDEYPNGAAKALFGSYVIDLSLDEEQLWKNIHTKHKNVIKRAIKNNVEVKFGMEYFDDAYNIIKDTLNRNNMDINIKEKLLEFANANKNNILIACSYLDDNIQSGAIIIYDKYKGYYFWGGTNEKLTLGSNNLLHWEVIKELKRLGVKEYDFVGARIEPKTERLKGIQRFKSRFGSILKEGYLWKYPIKQWKYKLFYILFKIRMKRGDIIDQEKNNINI